MKVIYKAPNKAPTLKDIPNTLDALRELVEGYIECVVIDDKNLVICNEESRLMGLEFNCTVMGIPFVGPILICGYDGEDMCDADEVFWLAGVNFVGWDLR